MKNILKKLFFGKNSFIQNDKELFTKTEGTEKPLLLTDVIVSTWKNLDAEIIAPYLSGHLQNPVLKN